MPFKSDKQRRYLWSQKPEVARQIAYKQGGGLLDYGQSLGYEREQLIPYEQEFRREGISPQDFIQDVVQEGDELYPTKKKAVAPQVQAIESLQRFEPPKPESRWSANWSIPIGHALGADWNTYGSYQDMSEGSDPWSAGIKGTWRFQSGGDVPMPDERKPKKVIKKDRYGNQVTFEYEPDVKSIDQTAIIKEMMNSMGDVPEVSMEIPTAEEYDHPGEPKGTDTVPAWLTPGEFVVNKEATEIYGPQIKEMNDHGRALQAAKGMEVPGYYNKGGWVTDELLDKLMEVESGGNPKAKSKAGAVGLYQWLPSSAKKAGYGVESFDPLNAKEARAATKKYLENMQKYHNFTPEETLRAYNWGPGNVLKYKSGKRKDIPAEALNYPGKILGVENIEGVDVPYDMPVPKGRPGVEELPTPRPGMNDDHVKDFLSKYMYDGGSVPHLDTIADEYNTYKPIADSITLGGEEDVDYTDQTLEEVTSNQNPMYEGEPKPQPDIPWWSNLLGPTSKEKLDLPLSEYEKSFLDKQTATNEKLASQEIAEEENQIADGYMGDAMAGADEQVMPGEKKEQAQVDDFKEAVKNETVKKIDEKVKKDPDATGPGTDQKGANANEEQLVKAAESDPSLVDKAGGFLKSAFGDLFDPKELARAAIIYAGSRAMGYSHSGSMQYIAKNYLTRVDAKAQAKIDAAATKEKRAFELAKTDKFTPASVAAFRKSGNPGDLVSKKSAAGATVTGVTEKRIINGKGVSIQQVKTGSGNVAYQLPNGKLVSKAQLENITKPYDPAFEKDTSEYRTRRARAVKDNTALFKEIQLREGRYKKDDEYKYKTGIIPSQAAQDFWVWAESHGVDPESDEARDVMGAAYRQAIAQSSIPGAPVAKNLKPFLEGAYIRQETGAPDLFQINKEETTKDPKKNPLYVRSDKMKELTNTFDEIRAAVMPNTNKTDATNKMVAQLMTDWAAEENKEKYIKSANKDKVTGFYLFAKEKADKWLIDRKLGE